jgi:Ca2+-binding RTX toxin-like protein
MFERLEARRLFSADAQLNGTVLVVTGGSDNDQMFVLESNPPSGPQLDVFVDVDSVFTNLATIPLNLFPVTRIVLDGGAGDDFLAVDTATVGVDISGGLGNDRIQVSDRGDGTAPSIAHGGDGDDVLIIIDGNNTAAYGDNGKDVLVSLEAGNTTYLYGGNAKDDLTGTGDTIIDGGNGKDTVNGVTE